MRTIREIDLFGDAPFLRSMTLASLIIATAAIVACVLAWALRQEAPLTLLADLAVGLLATAIAAPVHELLHALAFLALQGRHAGGSVSIGFQNAFLYTRYRGPALRKARFACVLLTPTVLLTPALLALCSATGLPSAGILAAGLHLSGCAGDLGMVLVILKTKGVTHVMDTDAGCVLLGPDGASED